MELRTTQRIRKYGNSYVVTIPKPYVDDGNLQEDHEYEILIRSKSNVPPRDTVTERVVAIRNHSSAYRAPLEAATRVDLPQEARKCSDRGFLPGSGRSWLHGLPIASQPIHRVFHDLGGRVYLTLDPALYDPFEELP